MSPEKYCQERFGMPSLKYVAGVLDLSQTYLKQTYKTNQKAFDHLCQKAHHDEQVMLRVNLLKSKAIQAA